MKTIFFKIYALAFCSFFIFSCEKDEDRAILMPAGNPSLSSSAATMVFTEEAASEEATTFSWVFPGFGFQAATQYALEFDKAGNNFASPKSVVAESSLKKALDVATLNTLLLQLGLEPGKEAAVEVRLRANAMGVSGANDKVEPLYSNKLDLLVTPYSAVKEPGFIYVPGAYQGWDPGTAVSLISVEDDGVYEGYVTFPDAESLEFKITAERSWDLNYGEGGGGTLSTDNAPNLKVAQPGTYQIKADLNNLTWSAKPYSWGIIGDATAGGWDTDSDLTFDSEERVWKTEADLTAGTLKFRLNDDWGTNYGDDEPSDEALNAGGANIKIAAAGKYMIILDLREEESPKYSITQL